MNSVIPSEFGISKPWHFIFSDIYKAFFRKGDKKIRDSFRNLVPENKETQDLDAGILNERNRIANLKFDKNTFDNLPIIIADLKKTYASGKSALKKMDLCVEKNTVLGLLGPVRIKIIIEWCRKVNVDLYANRFVSSHRRNSNP